MLKKIILLIVLAIIPTISVSASQPDNSQDSLQMQKIQGAFAFPITGNNNVKVRIGVDPKGLINKKPYAIATIMNKLTVIACAVGSCQFAIPNSGLGFFEANFNLPTQALQAKQFDLLVVACSKLGCAQDKFKTAIITKDRWQNT